MVFCLVVFTDFFAAQVIESAVWWQTESIETWMCIRVGHHIHRVSSSSSVEEESLLKAGGLYKYCFPTNPGSERKRKTCNWLLTSLSGQRRRWPAGSGALSVSASRALRECRHLFREWLDSSSQSMFIYDCHINTIDSGLYFNRKVQLLGPQLVKFLCWEEPIRYRSTTGEMKLASAMRTWWKSRQL